MISHRVNLLCEWLLVQYCGYNQVLGNEENRLTFYDHV